MPIRYMSGDIITFPHENSWIKAQIVRTYPDKYGKYQLLLLDEEGRVFRRDSKDVVIVGERIPGTFETFSAEDSLGTREKTTKYLKSRTIQDALSTIMDHPLPRTREKIEVWDAPMRMAINSSSQMSPELERYLTWSEKYKRRYESALQWLHDNAEVSFEVYVRCVIGRERQVDLARERGVSRPAITLRKQAAIEYIQKELRKAGDDEDIEGLNAT